MRPWPKILASLLLVLCAAPAFGGPVLLHRDLSIRLAPENASLEGTARLRIAAHGAERLAFSLAPDAVILGLSADGRELPWTFRSGRLKVRIPERSGEILLEIRYRGRFADPAPADPLMTEDPSYGVAATIGPQGIFLGSWALWHPEMEGTAAPFRLEVFLPAEMTAVSAGRLAAQEPGRTVWESSLPVRGLALAAGPYEVREGRAGKIPVYTFFYPQSRTLAETYLEAATGYIALYQDLFGPYPFEKFAVAENFFPTGYGFPSWTLLGSTVVRLPFIVRTSLGHEVAHSWWGNGVLADRRLGNWSEGLTTYVADYLYEERRSAEAGREYRLKLLRDYAALVAPHREPPLRVFSHRTTAAERAVGYGKGAMLFHMARRKAGEDAFWSGLRRMAQNQMFREADWYDFARAMDPSGEKGLAGFFRQWVERPGAPVLSLEEVRRERTEGGWRVSGVLRQKGPVYDLEIPLRLETGEGVVEALFRSAAERTPFTLESASLPRRLLADPEADIFRRLDLSEIPATVNGVKGSPSLLVVVAEGLPSGAAEAGRALLAALGSPDAPMRPEGEIAPADLADRDVLYLGLPARRKLLPPLPDGVTLGPQTAVLNGRSYGARDSTLFLALPHPLETGRTAALFLPGSAEAAADAARRIAHYGTYSYLAFSGGRNVDKGIWPVTASPLVHTFPLH